MADMKIGLHPFTVPNYVIMVTPVLAPSNQQDPPKWALREVDADVLSKMCNDFRASVFEKAKKADPEGPWVQR